MAGVFQLPNEKIEVRYIKKQKGIVTDTRHIAYGGLLEGAYITLPAKRLRNGQYANVLSNEEKEGLEKLLSLDTGGLSIYKKENNYWDSLKVRIGKEGAYLDLNEPEDFIKSRVLESYDDLVAPNINMIDDKQTYRFVIIRKDDEAKQTLKKVDVMKEAYKLLGKLEDNREASMDFLRIKNIKVGDDTSTEWLNAEVGKILNEDPKKFVQLLKDPSYNTKVLIFKALAKGEIVKKGSQYYSKDMVALAEPNQVASLENVITYLESNINQEYRVLLMSKI
jgi:hypothetical protein